jgi:hypothetical protein
MDYQFSAVSNQLLYSGQLSVISGQFLSVLLYISRTSNHLNPRPSIPLYF